MMNSMASTAASFRGQDERSNLRNKMNDIQLSTCALNCYDILDIVLPFLPLVELKQCRRVNKLWHDSIDKMIYKKSLPIRFPVDGGHTIEDIPRLIQLIESRIKLQSEMSAGIRPKGEDISFPWKKFIVDARIIRWPEDSERIINLFRAVAPFVKQIFLTNLGEQNVFPGNVSFEELKVLSLSYEMGVDSEEKLNCALQIINQAKHLKALNLRGSYMMASFISILNTPNGRNISHLYLDCEITNEQLIKLSNLDLQLKFLRLELANYENAMVDGLGLLLQSQIKYLEELGINCMAMRQEDPLVTLEFPCMKELNTLMVPTPNIFSTISYGDQFPKLRKLICSFPVSTWHASDPAEIFFNNRVKPVNTVTTLHFSGYISPLRIAQATRQFPELRKVTFRAVNILARITPINLHLEEVCLLVGEDDNLDEMLTEFSVPKVRRRKRLRLKRKKVIEMNIGPTPFFKNLKTLRLVASGNSRTRKIQLSNITCRYGLLKMKQLTLLEIVGVCPDISERVMEKMKQKFVVCKSR